MIPGRRQRILAVASAGGHWTQLLRLRPAFEGHDVAFATTNKGYRGVVAPARFYAVRDANRWDKPGLAMLVVQILIVLARERPDVVVTTGAAPGYFAIRLGGLLGARTVWIDSIANADELSLSGRMASKHADLCLTQWAHLSDEAVAKYEGSVL